MTRPAVNDKDIEITKDDGGVQMHVAYDDAVPYVANVSLGRALRQDREGAVIPLRKPDDLAAWVERSFGHVFTTAGALRRGAHAPQRRRAITMSGWNSWAIRFSIAAVARLLYDAHPQADEGALSRLRASLVSGESLAQIAGGAGLGRTLASGRRAN